MCCVLCVCWQGARTDPHSCMLCCRSKRTGEGSRVAESCQSHPAGYYTSLLTALCAFVKPLPRSLQHSYPSSLLPSLLLLLPPLLPPALPPSLSFFYHTSSFNTPWPYFSSHPWSLDANTWRSGWLPCCQYCYVSLRKSAAMEHGAETIWSSKFMNERVRRRDKVYECECECVWDRECMCMCVYVLSPSLPCPSSTSSSPSTPFPPLPPPTPP